MFRSNTLQETGKTSMQIFSGRPWLDTLLKNIAAFLVFLTAAWLGHITTLAENIPHTVYPSMGISLALMLLYGYCIVPGIFVSAFISSLHYHFDIGSHNTLQATLFAALIFAVSITAVTAATAAIITRITGKKNPFCTTFNMGVFVVFAGLLAPAFSTCIGVGGLIATGIISSASFSLVWSIWWIGTTIGVLLATPFIMTLPSSRQFKFKPVALIETIFIFILLTSVSWAVLGGWFQESINLFSLTVLLLLTLMYILFRFNLFGVVCALLATSGIAIGATIQGTGPFASESTTTSLLYLQSFITVMASTMLIFKMVLHERKLTEGALKLSEHRYRSLVENLHIGITLIGADRRIIMVNQTQARWLGVPAETLIGKQCYHQLRATKQPCVYCPAKYVLDTVKPIEFETVATKPAGDERHIRVQILPLVGQNNSKLGFIETIEDITEKKNEEELIRLLSSAIQQSTDGIAVVDLKGTFLYVNDALATMHGFEPTDLIGRHIYTIHPDNYRIHVDEVFNHIIEHGSFQGELIDLHKNGNTFPTLMHNSLFKNEEGDVTGMVCAIRNIEEQKKSAEEIQLLSSAVEQTHEGIAIIDLKGCILYANRAYAQIHQYDRSEIVGIHVDALHKSGYPSVEVSLIRNDSRDNARGDCTHLRLDGSEFPCTVHNSRIRNDKDEIIGIITVLRDVSAERQVQERIRLLSSAVEQSNEGIALVDTEGKLLFVNDAFAIMHGYTPGQLAGKEISSLRVYTDQYTEETINMTVRQDKHFTGELTHIRKNGSTFPCLTQVSELRDEQGKYIGLISSIRDITDLHNAEEALKESELRFRQAFEYASIGISLVHLEGRILQANLAMGKFLGYCEHELLTKNLWQLVIKNDHETINGLLTDIVSGKQNYGWVETQCIHTSGQPIWTLLSASIIRDRQGNGLYYVIHLQDISEQKTYRDKLQKHHDELEHLVAKRTQELNNKNRELTEFASTVAHDLQSPIRSLTSFCGILVNECCEQLDDQATFYIKRIISSARRMDLLIKDLLQFSRVSHNHASFEQVDLDLLIQYVLTDLDADIQEIGCQIHLDTLETVYGDKTLLTQLFQNLIGNSIKYNRPDVKLVISISSRIVERSMDGQNSPKTSYCEITLHDNGIGFEQEYAKSIFEPFKRLHTQTEFEGSGLGLATCRKIVERHGGTIRAEGQPNKGAAFIIELPIHPLEQSQLTSEKL